MILQVQVEGVGLVGPGLPGWTAARETLAHRIPFASAATVIPTVNLLPPNERRRAGVLVRASMAVAEAAVAMSGREASALPSVFTSSSGDGANCHAICEVLASDDRSISPTRFHNSVHNAPAGYWTIATHSMTASTSLCAHDASFAAGLLEACTQLATGVEAVLLVAADSGYPEPLNACRPIPDVFGVALVLSATRSPRSVAQIGIELAPCEGRAQVDDPALDALSRSIPAARSLGLLAAIASASTVLQRVSIDYLDTVSLVAEVSA